MRRKRVKTRYKRHRRRLRRIAATWTSYPEPVTVVPIESCNPFCYLCAGFGAVLVEMISQTLPKILGVPEGCVDLTGQDWPIEDGLKGRIEEAVTRELSTNLSSLDEIDEHQLGRSEVVKEIATPRKN